MKLLDYQLESCKKANDATYFRSCSVYILRDGGDNLPSLLLMGKLKTYSGDIYRISSLIV